jgi:hypothetical protein
MNVLILIVELCIWSVTSSSEVMLACASSTSVSPDDWGLACLQFAAPS